MPDTLSTLFHQLNRHNVDFVVCGGVACVLHGVSRVTNDIDLCIDMQSPNISGFINAVRELNAKPRIPEPLDSLMDPDRRQTWIREKNATVFTLFLPDSPYQIDVLLQYPIAFADLKSRATRMRSEQTEFLVSSRTDLIEAKKLVDPPRRIDQRDIEDLQELIRHEQET